MCYWRETGEIGPAKNFPGRLHFSGYGARVVVMEGTIQKMEESVKALYFEVRECKLRGDRYAEKVALRALRVAQDALREAEEEMA